MSLRDSIEAVYAAFVAYPLPRRLDCSPVIEDVWRPEEAALRARPLRALTADDLDVYAWRAMTTVGDLDAFKHFLPRLLELTALERDAFATATPEVLYGKLAYAAYATWPPPEVRAVDAHLDAVGLDLLTSPRLALDPTLAGLALCGRDLRPLLARWQGCLDTSPVAVDRLLELLERNHAALLVKRRLASAHTHAAPENVERLVAWLVSEPLRRAVEALFFAATCGARAEALSRIVERLEQLGRAQG